MSAFSREAGKSVSLPAVGCIGCGNMGGAVMRGLCAHESLRLVGHDHTRAKVDALSPAELRDAWRGRKLRKTSCGRPAL